VDSTRGESLSSLIRELNAIKGDFWIRLLYTHPAHWSDELIQTIADCKKVARYIDMPLQHISDHMLGLHEARRAVAAHPRLCVKRIRAGIPEHRDPHHCSSVGFPGETEDDFEELIGFIEEAKLRARRCLQLLRRRKARARRRWDGRGCAA